MLDPNSLYVSEIVVRLWTLIACAFFLVVVGMGLLMVKSWRIPLRGTACFGLRPEPAAQSRPFGYARLRGGR